MGLQEPRSGVEAAMAMRRGAASAWPWLAALGVCSGACSSAGGGGGDRGPAGAGGSPAGAAGVTGASTMTGEFGNANVPDGGTLVTPEARPGDLRVDCVGETQRAERVQIDMYIMLDRSGSMLEDTGAGGTKWDAVRAALTEFVGDPASEGLGVGLQYFPLGAPGIPEQCMSDADCGALGGPCSAKACLPPLIGTATFQTCFSDAQCPLNSPGCEPFGQCSLDPTFACFDFGADGCGAEGDCEPLAGQCLFYASCETADYAAPAVPIDVLPDNGMALVDSLAAEAPIGLTPTPAALQGALQQCATRAASFPEHRVIAVLATDGMPTDCLPQGTTLQSEAVQAVVDVAAAGLTGPPAVPTYVIGVFAPEDPDAMQSLDLMAQAGGTERAYIVDSASDVNAQFLAALEEIRGGTLACELELPKPPAGTEVDFNLVNVELTDAAGTRSLVYVESPDHCADSPLGWYYDVPPAAGMPTKISVCATTCDTLRAATDASVEIRLGCPPVTPI